MKLQGMSIIFALVIVPIILVISYYINLQVKTITLQTKYDTYLLNSTYDAMTAFEINTANEDLSTVSDSLRTIIEASYNVFISNLATNMGMSNASKSQVEPFIPSTLFTLYDGYYINAPTKVPTVLTDDDGNAIAVGDAGVKFHGSYYTYDKNNDEIIGYTELTDDIHRLDYGQLLYETNQSGRYTANVTEAKLETKNVLKTYMPYSGRYVGSNFDLTVIYTLDNYATIEGNIDEVYYTKSGYLIPHEKLNISIDFPEPADTYRENIDDYNQNDIQNAIENRLAKFTVMIKDDSSDLTSTKIVLNQGPTKNALNTKVNVLNNALQSAQELWYSIKYLRYDVAVQNFAKTFNADYLNNLRVNYGVGTDWSAAISVVNSIDVNNLGYAPEKYDQSIQVLESIIEAVEIAQRDTEYELQLISSVTYYAKAYIFSKWVDEYLCSSGRGKCTVRECDLVEIAGQNYATIKGIEDTKYDFSSSTNNVFDYLRRDQNIEDSAVTEIPIDSIFYQHKLNIIRQSIQYNLNLAMSTYNNNESYSFEYEMPVITADEWEQILTHISITSFMQGYKCGLKTYSNYKIVSSTNNDILTLPDEIYYVEKSRFNNEVDEYHRINCEKIIDNDNDSKEYIAFGSKEVKYDKIFNKNRSYMNYEYDHKNYACYDCINDGNYFYYDTNGNGRKDKQVNIFDINDTKYRDYNNLREAYYIGVGKERNDTYKMNAVANSQGYEIIKTDYGDSISNSTLPASRLKAIEIAVGTIYSENASFRAALYSFGYGTEVDLSGDTYSIATNNTANNTTQSLTISIIPGKQLGDGDFSFNAFTSMIKCQNADEILKVEYSVDADGNSNVSRRINAIDQFIGAIKYIRLIYK